jgi:hypothetical protein
VLADTETLRTECNLPQVKESSNIRVQSVGADEVTGAQPARFYPAITLRDRIHSTGDHFDSKLL